jgi:DsbC/DsbD-like thiol-disulfide interchange protein
MLLAGAAGAATAAESAWFDNESGRLRLVAAPADQNGVVRGFIDIELKPGWKTYWRDPGESGIPPRVEAKSGEAMLHFPPPVRIEHEYASFVGYKRSVRLPLTVETKAGTDEITASIFLGVCENICVPVQQTFTLALDGTLPPLEEAMIDAAFAELPDAPAPDFRISDVALAEDGSHVAVTAILPTQAAAANSAELFVTAPEGFALGIPVKAGHDGSRARFELPVERRPEGEDLSGEELTILVKTLSKSVEETVTLP